MYSVFRTVPGALWPQQREVDLFECLALTLFFKPHHVERDIQHIISQDKLAGQWNLTCRIWQRSGFSASTPAPRLPPATTAIATITRNQKTSGFDLRIPAFGVGIFICLPGLKL